MFGQSGALFGGMNLFNKAPGIGLDIGSKRIKLAQVKNHKQTFELVKFGSLLTPEGLVEGGIIKDPERLGEAMRSLVQDLKLEGNSAVSAVAGQQVYTRNIVMPSMPLLELREALQFQAMSFLPIPVEEAVMDIFPLREFDDDDGKKTEVFFVAVRKQQVEVLDIACKIAGLNLVAVEIEPIAVNRVLNSLLDNEVKAYLNVGASRSYFTVFRNGMMVFYRHLSFGFSPFFQPMTAWGAIAEDSGEMEQDDRYEYLMRDVVAEISRSVEYYEMQNGDSEITQILVCGGGTRLKKLGSTLSEGIGREVIYADMLSIVKIPSRVSEEEYRDLKHDFTVAIGLAGRAKV